MEILTMPTVGQDFARPPEMEEVWEAIFGKDYGLAKSPLEILTFAQERS
jgi:hypothetical protein